MFIGMFLYESVTFVCLSLSDEPLLVCIHVSENVVLLMFGWPQGR